jgi:hypothetical protein
MIQGVDYLDELRMVALVDMAENLRAFDEGGDATKAYADSLEHCVSKALSLFRSRDPVKVLAAADTIREGERLIEDLRSGVAQIRAGRRNPTPARREV